MLKTIAGTGGVMPRVDNTIATKATLYGPHSMHIDPYSDGNTIFVSEWENRVRKLIRRTSVYTTTGTTSRFYSPGFECALRFEISGAGGGDRGGTCTGGYGAKVEALLLNVPAHTRFVLTVGQVSLDEKQSGDWRLSPP